MGMRLEKDMRSFTFSQHQEFVSYYTYITKKGWTIEDVRVWVKDKIKQAEMRTKAAKKQIKTRKCPECSTEMFLRPVNIDAKTQTGDPKDKSVWMCPNEKCLHVIYNEKSVKEILRG